MRHGAQLFVPACTNSTTTASAAMMKVDNATNTYHRVDDGVDEDVILQSKDNLPLDLQHVLSSHNNSASNNNSNNSHNIVISDVSNASSGNSCNAPMNIAEREENKSTPHIFAPCVSFLSSPNSGTNGVVGETQHKSHSSDVHENTTIDQTHAIIYEISSKLQHS
uniref:Uncharacterized protein n=1 Tax=Lygus hesperus TaxID=30085 RepID=A0A0A9X5C9_LYGHE